MNDGFCCIGTSCVTTADEVIDPCPLATHSPGRAVKQRAFRSPHTQDFVETTQPLQITTLQITTVLA